MTPEPFDPDIAQVIDRAWADRESNQELDAEGRFVRGVYEGMRPADVLRQRDGFNSGE